MGLVFIIVLFPAIAQYQELLSRIKKEAPTDPTEYSNPGKIMTIPFPYLGPIVPTERFSLTTDKSFHYMGREKFAEALTMINSFEIPNGDKVLYIYGSIGYGKSHILAAMACLLIQQGKRVVYLPDCRAMLADFLSYLQAGLLLAFGDSKHYQRRIQGFKRRTDIIDFCKHISMRNIRLYFIVDQLNALDEEHSNDDINANLKKNSTIDSLGKIVYNHFVIKSASANHKSAIHMMEKQTNELKISLFGGLTKVWKFLC